MKLLFEDTETGYPIVLIHAFPLSGKMWKEQKNLLSSNGFRVIVPDLPGFGEDKNDSERISISEMAQQVLQLLETLSINNAIFCGLSMGGYVLFDLFRIAPDKFSALILCDTTYQSDTAEKRKGRFDLISKIEQSGASALIENMLPNLISEETKKNNPKLTADLNEVFSNVRPKAAINALQSMAERQDSTEITSQINVPTLLVFGEFDKITNLENARKMKELIADSELHIIEHAGHYSNLEQPEEFNRILLNFSNRIKS